MSCRRSCAPRKGGESICARRQRELNREAQSGESKRIEDRGQGARVRGAGVRAAGWGLLFFQ